jgi:hypothetical protein
MLVRSGATSGGVADSLHEVPLEFPERSNSCFTDKSETETEHHEGQDLQLHKKSDHTEYKIGSLVITKYTLWSAVAIVFMGIASFCNIMAFTALNKSQLREVGKANDDCGLSKAWITYGFLYQYVGFSGFILSRLHRPVKTFGDLVFVIFLTLQLSYHTFFLLSYSHCEKLQDYAQDNFQQFLSYPLATILVSVARYENHHHFHLETLFLLSAVLTGEITQHMFHEHISDEQAAILAYYNVKIGLVVFEVYLDGEWTKILYVDNRTRQEVFDAALFVFYIGSRLVEQFWYTTPDRLRYKDPTMKLNYNSMIWTGTVVEVTCLLVMIWKIIEKSKRNIRLDEGADDSQSPNIQPSRSATGITANPMPTSTLSSV